MRMTPEQWDAVINVNLKSVFNFTKAVQMTMLKQKSGSIINISSVCRCSGKCRPGQLMLHQKQESLDSQIHSQRTGFQEYPL